MCQQRSHLIEDTIEPSIACPGLSPWSSCAQELFSHNYFYVGGRALPGPRLQLNLEPTAHSARHALLHMASKWSSHWTTRAGLALQVNIGLPQPESGWSCRFFPTSAPSVMPPPLPSNRHHPSNGDCLEGKRENYQVGSVQYCVQQLCTVRCTHIWTD